jgi:hypothetical protein
VRLRRVSYYYTRTKLACSVAGSTGSGQTGGQLCDCASISVDPPAGTTGPVAFLHVSLCTRVPSWRFQWCPSGSTRQAAAGSERGGQVGAGHCADHTEETRGASHGRALTVLATTTAGADAACWLHRAASAWSGLQAGTLAGCHCVASGTVAPARGALPYQLRR